MSASSSSDRPVRGDSSGPRLRPVSVLVQRTGPKIDASSRG
ncbi:hypothetical protein [Nannocystis pusilla]|nr:hypothetical protein [Nannocystis pusilla]